MDDEDISHYIRKANLKPINSDVANVIAAREQRRWLLFGIGSDAFWEVHKRAMEFRSIKNPLLRRWVRCIRIVIRKERVKKTREFLIEIAKPRPAVALEPILESSGSPSAQSKGGKVLEPIQNSPTKVDAIVEVLTAVDEKIKKGEGTNSKLEPIVNPTPSGNGLDRQLSKGVGVRRGSLDKAPLQDINGRSHKGESPKISDSISSKNVRRKSMDSGLNTPSSKNLSSSTLHPIDHSESILNSVAGAALSVIEHAVDGIMRKTGSLIHATSATAGSGGFGHHRTNANGTTLQPLSSKDLGMHGVSEKGRRRSLDSVVGASATNKKQYAESPSRGISAKKKTVGSGNGVSSVEHIQLNSETTASAENVISSDSTTAIAKVAIESIANEENETDIVGELKAASPPKGHISANSSSKRPSSVEVPDSLQLLSSLA